MATSTPVVSSPASAFGVLLSPLVNIATQVVSAIGGGLVTLGGAQIFTKLLDPSTGPLAALANGNVVIGALLAGASFYVSHKLVSGSNDATLSALGATPAPTSAAA